MDSELSNSPRITQLKIFTFFAYIMITLNTSVPLY